MKLILKFPKNLRFNMINTKIKKNRFQDLKQQCINLKKYLKLNKFKIKDRFC
jgi:hypothetical protein